MAGAEDLSAVETLEKDRLVDDLLGGDESREGVSAQVNGTTTILGRGGLPSRVRSNHVRKSAPMEKL